jgi:hypothetical protein
MSLLNASDYGDLGAVSSTAMNTQQIKKYFSVFITGVSNRPPQQMGKYQCMTDMDNGKYVIQNADSVAFIPYFIKRYWFKTVKATTGSGDAYDKLVAFGWNDDVPKIDNDCKYAYTIAGALLDSNNKVMKHTVAIPDNEIKVGDPIFCYFKCMSTKFSSAIKFLDLIDEKAKGLSSLSGNPEFDKNVIALAWVAITDRPMVHHFD